MKETILFDERDRDTNRRKCTCSCRIPGASDTYVSPWSLNEGNKNDASN